MKLGAIITKEEFICLAPLGLEACCNGRTTFSYCKANAEAFKKWAEEHGELPSELIPGYIIKSCPRDGYDDFPDGVTHMHLRGSWDYFDNNDCIITKLPAKLLKQKQI